MKISIYILSVLAVLVGVFAFDISFFAAGSGFSCAALALFLKPSFGNSYGVVLGGGVTAAGQTESRRCVTSDGTEHIISFTDVSGSPIDTYTVFCVAIKNGVVIAAGYSNFAAGSHTVQLSEYFDKYWGGNPANMTI